MSEQFVIWQRNDPRVAGDNYSEVSKEIAHMGPEQEMMEIYQNYRNARKFAGNSSTSHGYPVKAKNGDKVGKKIVEYTAKTQPDDDDFHDMYADDNEPFYNNVDW